MKKTERYVYPAIFTYKAGQEIAVVQYNNRRE